MTFDRRRFLVVCTGVGIVSPLMPGVLYTLAMQAQEASGTDQSKPPTITPEMIDGLLDQNGSCKAIRKLGLANSVAPAFVFHPLPPSGAPKQLVQELKHEWKPDPSIVAPAKIEDLAFASIGELAGLLQSRKITSLALTQMYLDRLKRYDARLHFVINLTEERALAQAKTADAEMAAGKHRGPLHGIPWGAKDLLAVKGYPT